MVRPGAPRLLERLIRVASHVCRCASPLPLRRQCHSHKVMLKDHLLATGLTIALASGVGGFLWWEAKSSSTPATPSYGPALVAPALTPPPSTASPALRTNPAPTTPRASAATGGLYRCDGENGTRYQAEPCPSGTRQSEMSRGTLSVVAPPPVATTQRPSPESVTRPIAPNTTARPAAQRNERRCEMHKTAIRDIDAKARAGGSGRKMERLREARRNHVEQLWALKCGLSQ